MRRSIYVAIGAPRPAKKPVIIMQILQRLADVKKKETQYAKDAAAGPKKKSNAATPSRVFLSVVVKMSTPNAYMSITDRRV